MDVKLSGWVMDSSLARVLEPPRTGERAGPVEIGTGWNAPYGVLSACNKSRFLHELFRPPSGAKWTNCGLQIFGTDSTCMYSCLCPAPAYP